MKIAVLTCVWDRLDYTRHCFARLRELAGITFDHYVLDQGSVDGTAAWLKDEYGPHALLLAGENIGIWRGFNRLYDTAHAAGDYDVFVTFDNDCELLTPNTLRDVTALALEHNLLLSPRILGLRTPMPTIEKIGDAIDLTPAIGNIFMAIPPWVLELRRFDESRAVYGGDELPIAHWMREHGSGVGYANGYEANHYETTDGQHVRYPGYFARKAEMGCVG